jgi:hypothetical protein
MFLISSDHNARLNSMPGHVDVSALFTAYKPLHVDFSEKYSTWVSRRGSYKSATAAFTNTMDSISKGVSQGWENTIVGFYPQGSVRYIELFPQGRAKLGKGAYDQRLILLDAFVQAMGSDANLATLKTAVQAFVTTLKTLRDDQQTLEGQVPQASADVEAARMACAVGMYSNLGMLMSLFKDNPLLVGTFWELSLLRSKTKDTPPDVLVGTIAPDETLTLPIGSNIQHSGGGLAGR